MTGQDDPDELLTVEQIAARKDVAPATVYGWRHRGLMPDPDQRYGRLMLWRWKTVEGLEIDRSATGRPRA